ncbi:MAG: glycosyltransferase family 2 protein, partial [Pseudomonadota bacterium]
GSVNALPGNALFIEKSVFVTHPQFPEHLETCEDWVFTNTLAMQGDVILSDKTHFVHLGEDKSFATLFRKEIWRGTSNLGSIRGRKIELAEWPSFIVPMAVGGGLLVSVLLLIFGQWWGSLVLLGFSLLAPLLYTLRLKKKSAVPVGLFTLVYFYLVYFSARAVGMMKGLLSGETLRESIR